MKEENRPEPRGIRERIRDKAELAPLTTLELGGPARHLVEVADEKGVVEALEWARDRATPVVVLGGGSNVVVADGGVDALVMRIALRGITLDVAPDTVQVRAAAGEPLDELVGHCVDNGWAGLECLSGIPGTAGATPIQNVGAYGQEVAETIEEVRALDRESLEVVGLSRKELGFGYRTSVLRELPDRYVVLSVSFRLRRGGPAPAGYPGLARFLKTRGAQPSLAEIRAAVLELRRSKSMVLDPDDPNRRSVGSFFKNPDLSQAELLRLEERIERSGMEGALPSYPAGEGRYRIPAARLIEGAGFKKGHTSGRVGISTKHSLALVNRGGAEAAELIELAAEIRRRVKDLFGILLRPEPVFLGFSSGNPLKR